MRPLCLGIDPAASAGVALVEPGPRPRLLALRVVAKDLGRNAWAERAFFAMEGIREVVTRDFAGRPVVGWVELTRPGPSNGWQGIDQLSGRRWMLIQAAADAGFDVDPFTPERGRGFDLVNSQSWPGVLGLRAGKQGDGMHRVAEAERLVECDPTTFRGLGAGTVDAAEATLIAAARALDLLGIRLPKPKAAPKAAPKPKAPRATRARKAS